MADPFLMKGKVFADHCHKLSYPVYAEVKYDEVRLHVRYYPPTAPGPGYIEGHVEFFSYAGNPLANLWHWAEAFTAFMQAHNLTDLDLGVLVNGNFNDSYRWVRSTKGIPKEKLDKKTGKVAPALDTSMVQFYLFDIPHEPMPFDLRRKMLDYTAFAMSDVGIPTKRPQRWYITSPAQLTAKFIERRELGDEGLMVKSLDHTYQISKRIDGWLKMKPEASYDGKITKINQAVSIEGVPLDRAGSVDVLMEDGSTASPAGIPHELGRFMWRHPYAYMGQWVEFKCMERDRQGGYRHPSLTRLREAKA